MIREILLSTMSDGDDQIYEPPTGQVSVAVIGENAYLSWHVSDSAGTRAAEPTASFQVPARSLLIALQAGINDAQPTAADQPRGR